MLALAEEPSLDHHLSNHHPCGTHRRTDKHHHHPPRTASEYMHEQTQTGADLQTLKLHLRAKKNTHTKSLMISGIKNNHLKRL